MFNRILILSFVFLTSYLDAQDSENIDLLENTIEELCKLKDDDKTSIDQRKKLLVKFESKVKELALVTNTFNNRVYLSENCVKTVYSPDSLVRLFVWNNSLSNMTNYTNIVQHKENQKVGINVSRIHTTSIPYQEIEIFEESDSKYYLFKGEGIVDNKKLTTVRIYKTSGIKMEEAFEAYPVGKTIEIWSDKDKSPNLKMNTKNNTLSYFKYEYNPYYRAFTAKSARIHLKFEDGVFSTPNNEVSSF